MQVGSFDSELWDLPPEGTDMRQRVLKLLSLVIRSQHPHILAPSSITVISPSSSSSSNPPALHLQFPRATTSLSLRDAARQGLLRNGSTRRQIAFQLVSTVAFMHSHGIFHNFLTSDEILLSGAMAAAEGGDVTSQSILLTHFFQSSITPVSSASYMCSRNYRPPEVILGYKAVSERVDIWLLGCLLFEIATGDAVFSLISSKDNGVMKPMLLRQQLEQIVADIGAVVADDVPSDFVARHRDVVLGMKGEWKMLKRLENSQVERAEDWNSILQACLAFHPDKRHAATDLLKQSLFSDLEAADAKEYVEFLTMDEAIASSALES
jgi:serine/threonine protein kinase